MGKFLLPGIVGTIGIVLVVVFAIVGWVVIPNVIDDKIKEEVRLIPNTTTWKKWENVPFPVYLSFRIFHVSNGADVEAGRAQPILQEQGPYVYEEKRQKIDIKVSNDSDQVTYKQKITYTFRPDMSTGKEEDKWTVVNGAFMVMSTALFSQGGSMVNPFVNELVNLGEGILVEATVREILFHGFPITEFYGQLLELFLGGIPPEFDENRFGYYKHKNESNDGQFVIKSGVKNSAEFGKIVSWNDEAELKWWYPPSWKVPVPDRTPTYCNMINGTDGSIYQPFIKKSTVLYNFVTDICRSVHLVYKAGMEHKGIKGYRFAFPDEFYQDPEINEDNYCFCPSPAEGLSNSCSEGVVRIFPCKSQGPIVTSSPHFLHASPEFGGFVQGLKPDEELHQTHVDLEPNSGLMLRISKKVQINIELQAIPGFDYFKDRPTFLFPVFWADESVELDDHNADDLKSRLLTPMKITDIGKWVGVGVGALFVLIAGGILIARR